jgi:7-cyano-7-deazaguanine tRNA-ribosyltransferase
LTGKNLNYDYGASFGPLPSELDTRKNTVVMSDAKCFQVVNSPQGGRLGSLTVPMKDSTFEIPTPALYPVVALVTGTTARGGGLWKYVLQADPAGNGLLRRQDPPVPVMSEVLQFLDFSVSSEALQKWRKHSLRGLYNRQVVPPLEYSAPIFLDSGGFKLMGKSTIDLSAYGLSLQNGNGPKSILDLQLDLGGNIVATLDYPLLPGLGREEAIHRMQKSRDNAVKAALLLREEKNPHPFLFVAAHGQDRDTVREYTQLVFTEFKQNGLSDFDFGLAIGSLVPLRGARKYRTIIQVVQGVIEGIPELYRDTVPVHVFGITGTLIPILAYLGVDSFDSSTYAQEARSLKYLDPQTLKSHSILEMSEWTCECRVCKNVSLEEIQNGLTSSVSYRPLPCGHYKSKYYGDIALHNLELDFEILEDTRRAIEEENLREYLFEHLDRFPRLEPAFAALAQIDQTIKSRLSKVVQQISPLDRTSKGEPRVSLQYTPEDFNILACNYSGPPSSSRVLLMIPCSKGKPYSDSLTHRFMIKRLKEAFGEDSRGIHKVVLSGLYGPVPGEFENEDAVRRYNFQLKHYDQIQMELVIERVVSFLNCYGGEYELCVGYATSRAYREVLIAASNRYERLVVLPENPKSRRLKEFFRHKNIEELIELLETVLSKDSDDFANE